MKSSYGPAPILRPRAETMPAVTVPPNPNGLPIASTHSPGRTSVVAASSRYGNAAVDSIFNTAISLRGSRPITLAGKSRPSSRVTVTDLASCTTWLLVTTKPSALTMKPDPRASATPPGGGTGMPRRKPGAGVLSSSAAGRAIILVVIDTTAGFTLATRSEKSGNTARTANPAFCGGADGAAAARPTSALLPSKPATSAMRAVRRYEMGMCDMDLPVSVRDQRGWAACPPLTLNNAGPLPTGRCHHGETCVRQRTGQ